jgi:very-short-patch-repair endonuclease
MTVVSALRAQDLDPSRLRAKGAIMLRDFLAYAESGAAALPGSHQASSSGASPDPLLQELVTRLRREDVVVHENFGTAAHRIDLAIEDLYHPGRVLVAVETDGPRYAALRSTRDRDRLRPEQLERLGWTHLRVWSTDLFRDPGRELARILRVVRDDERVIAATGTGAAVDKAPGPTTPVAESPAASSSSQSSESPETPDETPSETADESPGESAGESHVEQAQGAKANGAHPEPKGRRKRRRVFRKGTGSSPEEAQDFGPTLDDTDSGWGEPPAEGPARDRWLEEQRPPHYE